MKVRSTVVLALLVVVMSATLVAARPQGTSVDLLITRASVIDTRTGAVASNRTIAIRGDTVIAIVEANGTSRFRAARTVDANGRHVIPGLWDMHMHFGGGDTLIAEN